MKEVDGRARVKALSAVNNARWRPHIVRLVACMLVRSIRPRLDGLIKIKGKGRWQGPGVFWS